MPYQPIVLGSNLIPDGALGALPGGPYSIPDEDRGEVVRNEDGTVTAPTYTLESNTPTFDLSEMQNIYGTKYMPMFRWISQKQTGTVNFDPREGGIPQEDIDRMSSEFEAETGISPEEALREQYKQEAIGAVTQVGAGIGGQVGRSIASTVGAGETFGLGNISEGFSDFGSNFEFGTFGGDIWNAPKTGPSSKLSVSPGTQKANLADLKGTAARGELKDFYTNKGNPKAFDERIADLKLVANDPKQLDVDRSDASKSVKTLEAMKTAEGGISYWDGFKDRFDTKSAAGKANIGGSIGAGVFTIAAGLASGNNLRESVQSGIKVGLGSYVGGLVGGGFGSFVGGMIGGRVICNELMRQGIMTRKQVILDYKFTEDYLTPQHVAGYHVWAVWMVRQMRKGRLVNFWTHVAGHRANEIAYIYGDRDKPDYLGKVYRKILEPICWSIGLFCKKTDWTVLYKQKEV